MSEPYLGQISMVGFNFAPRGWAMCNGQIMSIQQNAALFSLLGTTYGGNGLQNFALPDLRGRTPLHFGQGLGLSPYNLGEVGGQESHTLTMSEMPQHTHTPAASTATPTAGSPSGNYWAQGKYSSSGNVPMLPADIGIAGSNLPHQNLPPYLVVTFCIALVGIFPSRN